MTTIDKLYLVGLVLFLGLISAVAFGSIVYFISAEQQYKSIIYQAENMKREPWE
jgi:hypothetical protein